MMSVVKECYSCASAKSDKVSYYYEEPEEKDKIRMVLEEVELQLCTGW
jgi:hypothetical protein